MTDADNTIIFSKGKSIITSDPDGEIANAAIGMARPEKTTELEKKNGVYTFDMWINRHATNYEAPGETIGGLRDCAGNGGSNNYKNIASISQDFAWLDDEVM